VVSEEHEKKPLDFNLISPIDLHLPEVDSSIKADQSIPISQITVWIDPLDATQEYTEMKDKGLLPHIYEERRVIFDLNDIFFDFQVFN